ncbi:helix-turn-helix domain-containing protein [Pseudooceanicola sp. C21-150M6]|uniref:helix-turn-helix domain-containing protein n=1 Tax=Pseudooceanicola sp. C21-150M6 TaxID=3434355 RepID=UPI003D7F63E1
MIRRKSKPKLNAEDAQVKGFDDFDVRLGDLMRGERATMGKSLLDVQRELRIKADYISAIEDCNPDVFETPGFIAGYVRSYARYLHLDPDQAFAQFCSESGFATAHGMSEEASGKAKQSKPVAKAIAKDPLISTATPFLPERESVFSRIEPGALGSVAVLIALISALGYGGWSLLTEVQRVQFAPVDQAPEVLSDLDPIQTAPATAGSPDRTALTTNVTPPSEGLDRLYRPEALDVPVLVARDAPISTLNPREVGTFGTEGGNDPMLNGTAEDRAVAMALNTVEEEHPVTAGTPQVTENVGPGVTLVAVRPAWVRVSAADGTVVFEKILDAGEEYQVPLTEEPPTLRAGMAGSLYASVNGELRGPLGPGTSTIRNLALTNDAMTRDYAVADLSADPVAKEVMLAKARQLEVPTE